MTSVAGTHVHLGLDSHEAKSDGSEGQSAEYSGGVEAVSEGP
ncbi:MAG: hypothetical protein QOE59_1385 [Actinomycetota bacterium]|nr:hypothetical protein [Actinomycetota bacterium]